MSVAVRPVAPGDRQELLSVLERNLGTSQEIRFAWRHEHNPAGHAWSWFVYDCASKSTVGMASVFPRHMRLHGKPVLGGQVGDFVIDATHRSLGPAILLQRATFQPVDSGKLAFCYDCPPHDRGMATFVRLNMRANCGVIRYVFPLRTDHYLERKIGKGPWVKPLIAAANFLVGARGATQRIPSLEIFSFDERFGDEFSELDQVVSSSGALRSSRAAADLNWRYRDDPWMSGKDGRERYRALVARRAGELLGFVVFCSQPDRVVSIVDLFGRELDRTGPELLHAVIDICRREKMQSLHAYCAQDPALTSIFRGAGFHARERGMRVVAYAKPGDPFERSLTNSRLRWPFLQVETLV